MCQSEMGCPDQEHKIGLSSSLEPKVRFFLLLISIAAFGQPTKFDPSRQANGHPNLQCVWRNASIVAAFNVEGQKA